MAARQQAQSRVLRRLTVAVLLFFRFEEPPSEDKGYIVRVDLSESEDDGIDLCESEDDDIDLSKPEDDGEHVLKAS
jgi:hypothetical protein